MNFEVDPLPYSKDALAPAMSQETLEFHYEKHHKGYMKKLQAAIEGTPDADKTLEDVIKGATGGVFNNSAQVWNHTFFWNGMKPQGGGAPTGEVADLINRDFGSFDAFKDEWVKVGSGQFGSGYVWLVMEGDKAKVVGTPNAETPLTNASQKPLLTTDVWEHAYYLDHRNDRGAFLKVYLDKLVNWDFVAQNLKA
ncbi:MAG TPA: Fe-Mn family superoxide dismutase [Polyangiaceae bacterium LLY-WYZ-14_1]|jgi:Fe-Mn family superoxide dismutase|nr:Fe-Mn family superoxide dismutase [Polyangiaceae bacterium LLY-WYZ-14_1]